MLNSVVAAVVRQLVIKSKLPRRKLKPNDVKRRHLGGGRLNFGMFKPRYGRPAPVHRAPKLGDGL